MKPFKGGTLVPSADVQAMFLTDAGGGWHAATTWPAGAPDVDLYLQVWIKDAAGPQGWAASNALEALAP
jgi:hypothetical protein